LGNKVEFADGVQPRRYMLFQLADLICTLNLALQRFVKKTLGILASLRARDSLQFNRLMRLCKRNPTFL
jgi:hypothetical protein